MPHPPFCPTSTCPHHREDTGSSTRWYFKNGRYRCARLGFVQRYRCKTCGTYFSDTSFSIDYYAKRCVDYQRLIDLVTNGVGMRATARVLGVSVSAVACRIMRLCRCALSLHADLQRHVTLNEDLVADGFQSFWVSQYHPGFLRSKISKQYQPPGWSRVSVRLRGHGSNLETEWQDDLVPETKAGRDGSTRPERSG